MTWSLLWRFLLAPRGSGLATHCLSSSPGTYHFSYITCWALTALWMLTPLCTFHSSCSAIMDYCHLVEKQGWLPDGSFEISGSKMKSFSSGEKCISFSHAYSWESENDKWWTCTLLYLTWITNKHLPCSRGNSAQYYVTT